MIDFACFPVVFVRRTDGEEGEEDNRLSFFSDDQKCLCSFVKKKKKPLLR